MHALVGVPFTKMTGSGNDFVVFDARETPRDIVIQPEVIQAICSRHNGIGADGIVLLEPPATAAAGAGSVSPDDDSIRLTYFNRDGTLGELCGNATLCSTYFAITAGLTKPAGAQLLTDAGLVSARLLDGTPQIDLAPVLTVTPSISGLPLTDCESRAGFALVGVPHVVILTDALESVDVEHRGPPIRQHHSLQPAGANVNWIAPLADGRWAYRTFERGVEGETLACGTGAVAAAILLVEWGLAKAPVELLTRSGRQVTVSFREEQATGDAARLWRPSLRGEGRIVFRGRIERLG